MIVGLARRRPRSKLEVAAIALTAVLLCLASLRHAFSASTRPRSSVARDLLASRLGLRRRHDEQSDACPRLPQRVPGCEPEDFPAPRQALNESDFYEMLSRGFGCLLTQVLGRTTPSQGRTTTRRRLRNSDRTGCSSSSVPAEHAGTQVGEWQALARRRLCVLEQQLYPLVTSCRLNQQRGMYVKSSRYVVVVVVAGYACADRDEHGDAEEGWVLLSFSHTPHTPPRELEANMRSLRQCPKGLVVCAVVKNEAAYIQEWLAFHMHSGVEHFYLYFNEDEEDTMRVVQPFVEAGKVTVELADGDGLQRLLYGKCLGRVKAERPTAEWVSFHDVDEYLFRSDHGCMMETLAALDDRAALAVNWRTYSHSNHVLQLPHNQLLMEANVHTRFEDDPPGQDVHIKSVVRMNHTIDCNFPHYCVYEPGWPAKDELGRLVVGPFNDPPPSHQHIRLHHYHKRTLYDYLMKRLRGRASINVPTVFSFQNVEDDLYAAGKLAFDDADAIKPATGPVRALLGLPRREIEKEEEEKEE